jgi:hypothetical protein
MQYAMHYLRAVGVVRDVIAERFNSATRDRRGERRRYTVVWPDNTSEEWPPATLLAYYRGVRDAHELAAREVVRS